VPSCNGWHLAYIFHEFTGNRLLGIGPMPTVLLIGGVVRYRVHGVSRTLGTEISASFDASTREQAEVLANQTIIVSRIDEPEEPFDAVLESVEGSEEPVDAELSSLAGTIPYAQTRPAEIVGGDYRGIVTCSSAMKGCAILCGLAALMNIANFLSHGDGESLFISILWICFGVTLFAGALVCLAIRDIAMNSFVTLRHDHRISDDSDHQPTR
jgi:hypothetical protein